MISCTTGIFVIAIPTCKIKNSPRIRFHECDVYSYNGKNEVATGIKVSQRLGQCYNGSIITGCPAVEVITGNSAKNRINRKSPSRKGLSQILCKHCRQCKIEQEFFKAGAAPAAAALSTK